MRIYKVCTGIDTWWLWLIKRSHLFCLGTLYTAERIFREFNANKDCVVVSVTFMKPDCYSVRFAMKGIFANGYKEGQVCICMHVPVHVCGKASILVVFLNEPVRPIWTSSILMVGLLLTVSCASSCDSDSVLVNHWCSQLPCVPRLDCCAWGN